MSAPAKTLPKLAEDLLRDAAELERARSLTTPEHIWDEISRTADHSCRLLLLAADNGALLLGPLVSRRDWCEEIDTTNEQQLVYFWRMFAVPWLLAQCPNEFLARAGDADFADVKRDRKGRIVGRNGKPLKRCAIRNAAGEVVGGRIVSEPARVTDDYTESKWLHRLQEQAKDWADACRAAASLIDGDMTKNREGYHNLFVQIPDVIWDALEKDSGGSGDSVTRVVTKILQKHYKIDRSEFPPVKKAGRPPK